MQITVYTVSDCPFCAEEKNYLTSKGIKYEEKNLENNRDFLAEMLQISDNFAGTPVTKIEKDNGENVVLKGFTAEEFDQHITAGVATQSNDVAVTPVADVVAAPQQNQPLDQHQQIESQVQPSVEPVSPPSYQPQVNEAPVVPQDIQAQSNITQAPQVYQPPVGETPVNPPVSSAPPAWPQQQMQPPQQQVPVAPPAWPQQAPVPQQSFQQQQEPQSQMPQQQFQPQVPVPPAPVQQQPPAANDPLAGILNSLQNKAQ